MARANTINTWQSININVENCIKFGLPPATHIGKLNCNYKGSKWIFEKNGKIDKDKNAMWQTPDSQRAVWRNGGSSPAETAVQI